MSEKEIKKNLKRRELKKEKKEAWETIKKNGFKYRPHRQDL